MKERRNKHPSAFVACPYKPEADYKALKAALGHVPLEFHYADAQVKTKHVLDRIRRGMIRTDFCLFDITGWNPNVTLELGLAEGLNRNYYILFRPGPKKKRPPSDLEGLQRFQYERLDGFDETCLTYQLTMQFVSPLPDPRYVRTRLPIEYRDKGFLVAMRVLAHFKNHKVLLKNEFDTLARGSFLRSDAKRDLQTLLIELMKARGLVRGSTTARRWSAGRSLYKNLRF